MRTLSEIDSLAGLSERAKGKLDLIEELRIFIGLQRKDQAKCNWDHGHNEALRELASKLNETETVILYVP